MQKILVVLTGGTIGSAAVGHQIDVSKKSAHMLTEKYIDSYGGFTEFETVQPLNILSENIRYSDWNVLCTYLLSAELTDYDGVIVTHGSDTVSYTAALLGMVMRHTPVPLVLVASNYPLADSRSNGLINFKSAVDFISEKIRGVFVSYAKNSGENTIYIATRMRESDPYLDEFTAFGGTALGKMVNGKFIYAQSPLNPTLQELQRKKSKLLEELTFKNNVLFIRQYPNIDYRMFRTDHVKAVLLYLYHSATASTDGGAGSAVKFVRRCKDKGIAVYGASFKEHSHNDPYATSASLLENGVIPLYNISPEAAYAKLCLAFNTEACTAKKILNETLYFENL